MGEKGEFRFLETILKTIFLGTYVLSGKTDNEWENNQSKRRKRSINVTHVAVGLDECVLVCVCLFRFTFTVGCFAWLVGNIVLLWRCHVYFQTRLTLLSREIGSLASSCF